MNILYIANARIPTEKAHGIQIMKTCEAFAEGGQEVTLLLPWRFNAIKENPFDYYGVKENFKIRKIFSFDLVSLGQVGFLIQSCSFSLSALCYSLFIKKDVLYSRDEIVCWFLLLLNKKVYWEAHTNRYNFFARSVLRRAQGIITISHGLKEFFVSRGVSPERICVAPDGVDVDSFTISASKEEARKKLNLPLDKKIVLYTGHLYEHKGAGILAEASKLLDELVLFVGGTDTDITAFKKTYGQLPIQIEGRKPHSLIPHYLKSADVLVLPNSAKDETSRLYTSPMKLFEYMASGTPIVTSDTPSIREVLNEKNSILVEPDSSEALAHGIKKIIIDGSTSYGLQAQKDVLSYTWKKRVEKISNCIQE
jgi:glycosyltransferase involved in cell wall biosynthesis